MNIKPLSKFIVEDRTNPTELGPGVVWAQILDDRYFMEVVRTKPYNGEFRVFDNADGNKLVWQEAVGISFNAPFGVDVNDMAAFQDKGIDVVDNKLPKIQD